MPMFMRCLCAGLSAPDRGATSVQAVYNTEETPARLLKPAPDMVTASGRPLAILGRTLRLGATFGEKQCFLPKLKMKIS
jgi:hypothetical protein